MKQMLKLSPVVAIGVAAATASVLLGRRLKRPDHRKALGTMGKAVALSSVVPAVWPLFTQWKAHQGACEVLLADLASDKPDCVVVTGDFATLADPVEFALAGKFLQRLEEIVGTGNIIVTPGNHDAPIPVHPCEQGDGAQIAPVHQALMPFHGGTTVFSDLHRLGEVSVLVMDSVAASYPFNSEGRVSRSNWNGRQRSSCDARCRIRSKVLCLHHPLVARPGHRVLSGENLW